MVVAPVSADVFEAARKGDIEAVKAALDAGTDANAKDDKGSTLLNLATRYGHLDVARLLVERGADLKVRSPAGGFPIHSAVQPPKDPGFVRFLLEQGADPNATDQRGRTPIFYAATNGGQEAPAVVAELVKGGADVMARAPDGQTPLHAAAQWGPAAGVQVLLDNGAQVDAVDSEGRTPLQVVDMSEAPAKTALLLKAGADIHARDAQGATPLHAAAGRGRSQEAAKALLDAGADVNATDKEGRTPLDIAVNPPERFPGWVGVYVDMVRLLQERGATGGTLYGAAAAGDAAQVRKLLDGGADPKARLARGKTALHFARWADEGGAEAAKVLLDAGADVNARDDEGTTPLHTAVNSLPLAELLIERGAEISARDNNGNTPLNAASRGDAEVVRLLIEHGGKAGDPEATGRSPLMDAVCCGDLDVIEALLRLGADAREPGLLHGACGGDDSLDRAKLLIEHGADPRGRGSDECTLLHAAAESSDLGMARLALEAGVDANARNKEGRTALSRTVWNGGVGGEMWRFLIDQGADPWVVDNEGLTVIDWAVYLGRFEGVVGTVTQEMRTKAAARNIHMAALHGDADAVRKFLDEGVSPNARHSRDRKTPLHWAVRMGRAEVVKLLTDRGADVNAREANGDTPLDKASEQFGKIPVDRREITQLLVDHGARKGTGTAGDR